MPTTPKSQVLKLADLLTYQEGAIVSYQITKTEAGNVTLFAFDAGQELSEHTTPFDALVHILDGDADVRLAGVSHILTAGDAIIMPADVQHALRAITKFKMLLTMIKK